MKNKHVVILSILSILSIFFIIMICFRRYESFQSMEEYLIDKYSEFRPATEIGAIEIKAESVPELDGKEFLTLKDIHTVKLAIDNEITRLETIRSLDTIYQKKQTDLEELSFRLLNILSAIGRNDAKLSDYPIRITTAKLFLETFRMLDKVPILFENIYSPSSASIHEETPFFSLVQKLKMELEQRTSFDIDSVYLTRINALEKRLLNNYMLGNPIPKELRSEFLNIIKQVYTNFVIQ